ncbi:MAG: phenylacetic acid degradation protein PaaN [bacterium]|nr:phenylacetic acid degradation protein PaaN [bacterium]
MMELFQKHQETLKRAVATIGSREYWSSYPESPRAYGEDAPTNGEAAFQDRLGKPFEIDQLSSGFSAGGEFSPYGIELGVTYPTADVESLISAATTAMEQWGKASIEDRVSVCLEILDRLKENSFEMAHAVMQTTGQAFLMAFQAGGPHALDRGLEAVAYAYAEMTRLPGGQMQWEKPQGKRDPLLIEKQWRIRPRGIAVTVGVSTFPTWNGYPGIFASLATGNPVIIKPHPGTILPLALFAETARTVLAEAGFDPNTVMLAVDTPDAPIAKELVMDPAVGIVDYTGGSSFGDWLEENVTHALVFTEKAGVNSVVIDSVPDLKGVFRNLSVSLTMYSGQMCTTPQNVYVPASGITVGEEQVSFDEVASGLAAAIDGLLADNQRAGDILGSIKGGEIAGRIADAAGSGYVLLESREIAHPNFADAEVRSPVIVKVDAEDTDAYMREMFGPVIYVIATSGTEESLRLAKDSAIAHGALTWLIYTTDSDTMESAIDSAVDAGVSVAFNLAGGLYVNQSTAFSDFHVTGANPAGNASLTDPAFVAGRFRVVGIRISA